MDILYFFSNPAMPEGNEFIAARRYDAVYTDSTAERAGLAACLGALKKGDVLHIARETHLGDGMADVVELLASLARKGVDVHVRLGSAGRLVRSEGSPFLRLSAEAAAAIVKFRQAFTARKAREGFQQRIARGERVGRPRSPLPEGFAEARTAWLEGRMTGRKAALQCGIAYSTFAKRVRG